MKFTRRSTYQCGELQYIAVVFQQGWHFSKKKTHQKNTFVTVSNSYLNKNFCSQMGKTCSWFTKMMRKECSFVSKYRQLSFSCGLVHINYLRDIVIVLSLLTWNVLPKLLAIFIWFLFCSKAVKSAPSENQKSSRLLLK